VYQFFFKEICLTFSLLLLSLFHYTHAQSSKIDSLKKVLSDSEGISRYHILYNLALQTAGANRNAEALPYIEEANKLAYDLGDSLQIVRSGRLNGQIFRRLDDQSSALAILMKVLPISKRNQFLDELPRILNTIALIHTFRANYDDALKYHFECLVIRERIGKKDETSITLMNIGLVYFKMKNHERALDYYMESLKSKTEVGDKFDLERLLINIGLCYNQLFDFDKALQYFNKAFAECKSDCDDNVKMEGQFGIGVANMGLQDYDEAISYFNQSLALAKHLNNKRFHAENLILLSRAFVAKKEFKQALQYLGETEELAGEADYNEILIDAYKEYFNIYNQENNFEKASHYQRLYISLKDSIFDQQMIDNVARVTTAFAERVNIATIKANEQVIKQQRDLNVSFAIIALLAGLLILLVQRSNRTIKRVNVALSDAKNTIEEQNAKLQILNTDLDAEVKLKTSDLEKANQSLHRVVDELDNFIYKTSHDIRGPLASLKGICNIALLDVKDDVALKYLHKLDVTAEKLNTILTRLLIVNQINNSSLKTDELVNFEQVVSDVLLLERKKGLPPRLKIDKFIDKDLRFFSDKEFVRIILENLIDNAIKFYNDSERIEPFVRIYISKEKNQILIRVIDNGIGISEIHPDKIFQMFSRASERSETGGIGLFITKTATEKLGGTVSLKTTPEGYTEFFVRFNVDNDGWRK
jgi:signal transduction histidine kinase